MRKALTHHSSNLLINTALCYKPCFAESAIFASVMAASARGLN